MSVVDVFVVAFTLKSVIMKSRFFFFNSESCDECTGFGCDGDNFLFSIVSGSEVLSCLLGLTHKNKIIIIIIMFFQGKSQYCVVWHNRKR